MTYLEEELERTLKNPESRLYPPSRPASSDGGILQSTRGCHIAVASGLSLFQTTLPTTTRLDT